MKANIVDNTTRSRTKTLLPTPYSLLPKQVRVVSGKIFLILFLTMAAGFSFAQEPDNAGLAEEGGVENKTPAPKTNVTAKEGKVVLPPELRNIEMEINTSTLPELAAWCRALRLSEGGDVSSLKARLLEYFKIPISLGQGQDGNKKIITIESARSTEYFKIEVVDEEYARLSGDVKVSLKDGDTTHRIRAWDILFNRTRNIITASGGVEYAKEDGDKIETFKGDSITVNIDNWSSVFLGGLSERTLQGGGATYLFSGTVISRNDEEVTILNKATISSANNEEALWSLNASKVWLLPGSDFAIFNAVLKVGEIPVLYIPFFHFPSDEIVFHPVIGYRSREGNYIQTTTYVLGRREGSNTGDSSLSRILGNSNDMEKKREGLFLRSTGRPAPPQSSTRLKVMLDYYTNLGGFAGAELLTPQLGILDPINFTAGLGFSRTVIPVSYGYTPFAPNYDGTSDWNSSRFFSLDVPFRYRFIFKSGIKGKLGSLSWDLPYFSDPWMERDFATRAEDMDWINMIQKGAAQDQDVAANITNSSYAWNFTGNLSLKFPNMQPYISNISLNALTSSIGFKYKAQNIPTSVPPDDPSRYSPTRDFFIPINATLYSIGGSISGTPVSFGNKSTPKPPVPGSLKPAETPDPFKGIGKIRSPWESEIIEIETKSDITDVLKPPVLAQRFDARRKGNVRFSFDYKLSPTSASQLEFDSDRWEEYGDINWGDVKSVITNFRIPDAGTSIKFDHSEGLFSNSFSFSGNGQWQQYTYINEDALDFQTTGAPDPAKVSDARKQQYGLSNFFTNYSLSSSWRPLYRNSVFSTSSLVYNLSGPAVKSNFIGDGDNPEWEMLYGAWDKDKISSHSLSANLSATVMDKAQNISISATLPPKDASLTASANMKVWISDTNAGMTIRSWDDDAKRKFDPLTITERLSFGSFGSFSGTLVYDWGDPASNKEKGITSINSNLSLPKWWLSASYSATRSTGYKFDPDRGWVVDTGDDILRNKSFSLGFNPKSLAGKLWDDRISYAVNFNSQLSFDLQKQTNSSFNMSFGFTLGISNFLDFSIGVNSSNTVIYRYYRSLIPGLPPAIINDTGPKYNLFLDLLNSFGNESQRKSSGFKMNSFTLRADHKLGDWNASFSWTMNPYLPAGERQYKLNSEISFGVHWVPVGEIKTDMTYSKRDDRWTIK